MDSIDRKALEYHSAFPAGKIAVKPTKPTDTQEDLSLAYTPGVAAPVMAIADNIEDRMAEKCHRTGQQRGSGSQAGNGRQGIAVQDTRRCGCL